MDYGQDQNVGGDGIYDEELRSVCSNSQEDMHQQQSNSDEFQIFQVTKQGQTKGKKHQNNQNNTTQPYPIRNKKIKNKDVFLGGFEWIKNPQLYNENNLQALKNKAQEYQNMKINELQNYSTIYEKKLKNVKKRQFMNNMNQHQFNIVCQQLLKKKNKYKNSKKMLQQKYVNLYFDWINLLDLRNKQEINQQFEEIVEILQQIKGKQDQQYFNKYQIYDFANLSISLIEQFIQIQIYDVKENRYSEQDISEQFEIYRELQIIQVEEMYEEQQISEVNTKLTEKYAKFFTSICDLRDQKYNKKMQLNFTKQTIEMLLENDTTKQELKEVIKVGIKKPKSWFNDGEEFNQEKENELKQILENLKGKYQLL